MEHHDYSQHASERGTTGGVAQTQFGPAAAGRAAAADRGAAAAADHGVARVRRGLAERATSAPVWSKLVGLIAVAVAIATTIVWVLGKTDLVVGGYVIAVAALLVGAVPLFRG